MQGRGSKKMTPKLNQSRFGLLVSGELYGKNWVPKASQNWPKKNFKQEKIQFWSNFDQFFCLYFFVKKIPRTTISKKISSGIKTSVSVEEMKKSIKSTMF